MTNETSPSSDILLDLPPSLQQQQIEHQKFLEQYIWRSCCGLRLDKRLVLFLSQFSIAIIIIAFSLYRLHLDDSCESQQIYIGLITLIVGVFLPAPKVK